MKIDKKYNGFRLDIALESHESCHALGKRARKRLCEQGKVLVNNMPRQANYKVYEGQEIEIIDFSIDENEKIQLEILKEDENYIAFYKNRGIPSVELKGINSPSLESVIQEQFPATRLLNRLDNFTSGIIITSKNEKAYQKWKDAQDKLQIKKSYLAYVENEINESHIIDNLIDLSKTKVKVLDKPCLNERKTEVYPLCSQSETSLVKCIIYKGQRHQIRAHLAYIGNPLVYDTLYGYEEIEETQTFMLHHYKIESELFCVEAKPRDEEWKILLETFKFAF